MNSEPGSTKRIPTLLALFILVSTIFATVSLVNQRTFFIGRASTVNEIQNLNISNISDSSFNVSFTTPLKTKALVILNKNGSTEHILDDRDKRTGQQLMYFSHFITVPNLSPGTEYTFKILINENAQQNDDFRITTGPIINAVPSTHKPIQGRIYLADNSDGIDTIITAKTNTSQKISAITDENGRYTIFTTAIRTANLASFLNLKKDDKFTVEIFRENLKSTIQSAFKNSNKLPNILLGENYSFLNLYDSSIKSAGILIASPSGDFAEIINAKSTKLDNEIKKLQEDLESSTLSSVVKNPTEILKPTKTQQNPTSIPANQKTQRNTMAMTGISLSMVLLGIILLVAI